MPSGTPLGVRRRFVHGPGRTAAEKLAELTAKRAAADARRADIEKARKERVRVAREASLAAQKALQRALRKAAKEPDPDDTAERKAARIEARRAAGKAKGKVVLPGRERQGSIDATDVALILALKEKEATNREIAQALNVGSDTVARVLSDFADTRPVAKAYLRSKADQLARDAVDASHIAAGGGKGDISLELLDRLDIAPKRVEETGGSKTVIVIGSNPSSAALPHLDVKQLAE